MCLAEKVRLEGGPFAIAHCNFGLRGEESDGDEAFVKEWADQYGIPLHIRRFETEAFAAREGISIEMAARRLRYHWFGQLCREHGYEAVAVAHNANDNAETLLLNLLRGTGLKGLLGMKAEGKIKHLGFSCHGSLEVMKRFLEKYGEFMEFGMIQMNYLDYNFQGAKGKLDLLNSYRIPVWVMEPLRGGMLAKMAPADLERMRKTRPGIEPVELAFRFLQSLPGVTVILSGMTEMEQMREKLRIFEKDEPLSKEETDALLDIAKGLINGKVAPCTACKYCLSHCPKELNIPVLLEKYNEDALTGGGFIAPFAIKALPPEKRPSACIGCKSCEKVCPQQIRISEILKAFGSKMDGMLEAFFGKEA